VIRADSVPGSVVLITRIVANCQREISNRRANRNPSGLKPQGKLGSPRFTNGKPNRMPNTVKTQTWQTVDQTGNGANDIKTIASRDTIFIYGTFDGTFFIARKKQ